MKYTPCTLEEEKEILKFIGIEDFEGLLKVIPKKLRFNKSYKVKDPLSEIELIDHIKNISNKNIEGISYIGSGSYDRYVPSVVDFISSRSEFYTAYTPYQAEVSQGTLQYIYEYQSMICSLTGMDASNASLYDGGSAVAEAAMMSYNYNKKNKILVSPYLNRNYLSVLRSYIKNLNIEIVLLPKNDTGSIDISKLSDYLDQEVSCIIVQSPNYFGQLEDWSEIKKNLNNTLLIAVSDPISLSILKSPGECNADIYVGEGQGLGNHLSYGGPYLGLIAVKKYLIRKLPGRIVGKTSDSNGKIGYTLTLQTREQHIRRERATSNICTNQGLMALRATIYLSLLGVNGLKEINSLCINKSKYLAAQINNINGFELVYKRNFINEFLIKTKLSARKIANYCKDRKVLINNIDTNKLLFAVTEKRTKAQMDYLISILKEIQ